MSLKNYYRKGLIEAGCDEAGRGCLAGPVYAAAVILPPDFDHPLLNDSKQMTEAHRYEVRQAIKQQAIAYAIGTVDNNLIDKINILNASILAMHLAVGQLETTPQMLLIDGNRFKQYQKIKHKCIVRGDSLYKSIAAASVLAKTYRDDHMKQLHAEFPQYGWNKNKGYPTQTHRDAIKQNGITKYHRKSFAMLNNQLELLFE